MAVRKMVDRMNCKRLEKISSSKIVLPGSIGVKNIGIGAWHCSSPVIVTIPFSHTSVDKLYEHDYKLQLYSPNQNFAVMNMKQVSLSY